MDMTNDNRVATSADARSNPPFKILIVDDAVSVRLQIKEIFSNTDVAVIDAKDGFQALEQCKNNPDINLIICDLNMPLMDGYEFLAEFHKAWPAGLAKPRIVILTTEVSKSSNEDDKTLGILGWIPKPPSPVGLRKFVDKMRNG
jgi:CheY-like chemotaxis protein